MALYLKEKKKKNFDPPDFLASEGNTTFLGLKGVLHP